MVVKVLGRDFDRLTQTQSNLQSCTYLLQLLEENAAAPDKCSSELLRDACARAFLYEAQQKELDEMCEVFERASLLCADGMKGRV